MRAMLAHTARIVLSLSAFLSATSPAAAQEPRSTAGERTAASIEYVGADGLYLAAGSDQGVVRGDTVTFFADLAGSEPLGRLVFTSVTRRRAVALVLDGALRLQRGDVVFLPLVPPGVAESPSPPDTPQPAPSRRSPAGASGGPLISGRISLDLEARETRTSWSGDLFGETKRRFATPTSRLSLLVSELPGGFTVHANVRASYRYDELGGGPPPASVRAYELAAMKSFEAVPLEIVLGRFSNPYERYSAYWDGALLRIGRASGLGAGVAAGFEPELHNEGFSRALPKLTAFVDFAGRGDRWRYDTDASFHLLRPDGGAERRFVGWSQRLTLGRLSLSQRARADAGAGAARWSLAELRVRGAIDLVGPLRLRGTYSRTKSAFPMSVIAGEGLASPLRREVSLGLDLSGAHGYLSVEGGRTERDGNEPGLSLHGSSALRVGAVQLLLAGQRWSRADARSWSVAPGLFLRRSSWDWRGGYRLYLTSDGVRSTASHAADGQFGVTLTRGTRVSLRGEQQWGESLSGTRLTLSVWRAF